MLINLRNALMAGKRLPYDAELEYLESTGKQYIDTGIVPGSDVEFEFWFSAPSYSATFYPLFGSYSNGNYLGVQRNSGGTPYSLIAWRGSSGKKQITSSNVENYEGVISLHGDIFTFKEDTYAISTSAFNGNTSMWYGRVNGIDTFGGSRLIGFCKIWKDSILVRDYIPVRFTNEQGVSEGAMYDRVSGRLFGNAGTGAFTYGNDLRYPIPSE